MNREILFRGYREDNGAEVYGFYMILFGTVPLHIIVDNEGQYHRVDPETVVEFTGLVDKNGKKIFDRDIIEWDELEWGSKHRELVFWDYSLFSIRKDDWEEWCEVVGNVHDNPELLEVD